MNKTAHRIIRLAIVFGLVFGTSSPVLASAASGPAMRENQSALLEGMTYYVSTTGRDTNAGTSTTTAFKTFAKAVSILAPGDTLQVMPGTYYEKMVITNSGLAGTPINVIGNGAVLNMKGVQQFGIRVKGSYVNVSNFDVKGATDAGIFIEGKYVTVKDNSVHNNVTENGVSRKCGKDSSWSSALKVTRGGTRAIIEGNTVYYNCGEGIAVTRGASVLIRKNKVYDNYGPNIYIDNSPYTRVLSNQVYCTDAMPGRGGKRPTGISLGEEYYKGWGARLHHITVARNTIKNCGIGIGAFASEVNGTFRNVTITRNKVPSGQARPIALFTSPNQDVVISYNTLFTTPWIDDKVGVTLIGNMISGQ